VAACQISTVARFSQCPPEGGRGLLIEFVGIPTSPFTLVLPQNVSVDRVFPALCVRIHIRD